MLNYIYLTCILVLPLPLLVSSLVRLWLIREVLNLLIYYVLFKTSKESSSSDIIQYIFIMFRLSMLIIIGIMMEDNILTIIRLWRKLGIYPFHTPTLAIMSKIQDKVVLFLFILTKLPYLIICSICPSSLFLIPSLRILFLTRSLTPKESIRVAIVVSSTSLALIFSISVSFGIIVYTRRILWGVLVGLLRRYANTKHQKANHRLVLNILLPIPRSYSWIIKIALAQYRVISLISSVIIITISCIPAYYVISLYLKHNNTSYSSLRASNLYPVLPAMYVSMIIVVFIL